MPQTQQERRADTRARLLSAAADLFARKGFHAVSAEAVAAAADRTTGALYSHFGGKEGLLLALLEVWKQETIADLSAVLEADPVLDHRLAALWSEITGPSSGRGDAWLLLEMELWLHGARDAEVGSALADRFATARRNLGIGLEGWAEDAGITLHRPVEDLALSVLGLLMGTAIQHRLDPAGVPTASVVAALSDLLGGGRPPDGDPAPGRTAEPTGSAC